MLTLTLTLTFDGSLICLCRALFAFLFLTFAAFLYARCLEHLLAVLFLLLYIPLMLI